MVCVKALSVNSEVLSMWKPPLLLAASECSSLFVVHKPGWVLELLRGLGDFGKVQMPGFTPDLLSQSFCEWT